MSRVDTKFVKIAGNPETLRLRAQCLRCGEYKEYDVPRKDAENWKRGAMTQDAFPYLSADEREILVSGVCGKCFDAMLSPEEG